MITGGRQIAHSPTAK